MKILHVYLWTCIVVFAFTSVAKFASDFGLEEIKYRDYFLTFLSIKSLMLIAAVLEALIVAFVMYCLLKKTEFHSVVALLSVMWLLMLFATYKIGTIVAPHQVNTCKCLGIGTVFSSLRGDVEYWASILILGVLTIVGASLMLTTRKLIPKYLSQLWLSKSNVKRNKIVIVTIACFTLIRETTVFCQDIQFNPAYTAQGIVEDVIVINEVNLTNIAEHEFEWSMSSNGMWKSYIKSRVNLVLGVTNTNAVIVYRRCAYDGTNLFNTSYGPEQISGKTKNDKLRQSDIDNFSSDISHTVNVYPGPLPKYSLASTTEMALLWLAFIGGDHAVNHPQTMIPSYHSHFASMSPISWSVELDYELFLNTAIPLLKEGTFRLNQSLLSKDLSNYQHIGEPPTQSDLRLILDDVDKYLSITNESLLELQSFAAKEIVRGSDFAFPKSFILNSYRLNTTNSQMRANILHTCSIQVTNWFANTNRVLEPLLPKITSANVLVLDYRFARRTEKGYFGSYSYYITNHIWTVSTNDARINYSNQIRGVLWPRTKLESYNIVYVICIVFVFFLVLLPIGVICKRFLRNEN